MKDQDLDKFYNNFLALFTLPGWTQLLEELEITVAQINDIRSTSDNQDLFYRKGQLDTVTTLLNFESSIRETVRTLEEDEDAL